eukprot:scaffold1786_cov398-Prasinococcus_capsulatus_cf.AAC.5
MGKVTKATKKFQKTRLKGEIERRRARQKVTRSKGVAAQRVKSQDASDEKGAGQQPLEHLTADEFLSGKFLELGNPDEATVGIDDSDEDDVELPAAVPLPSKLTEDTAILKEKLTSDISKHKSELEQLKKRDPEFYKYLQENDRELLDFNDSDEEAEAGAEDEEEQEEGGEEEEEEGEANGLFGNDPSDGDGGAGDILTNEKIDAWCAIALSDTPALGSVRNLLRAFRSACHYGDGDEDGLDSLAVGSSQMFNKIMLFMLKEASTVFAKLLVVDQGPRDAKVSIPADPKKSPRWSKVEPLVRSYFGNAHHVLEQMTDEAMISFALRQLTKSVRLLVPLERMTKKVVKQVTSFYGKAETAQLCLSSALFLRQVCIDHTSSDTYDLVLKGMYREMQGACRFMNATTLPRFPLMASCIVEICGLRPGAAYLHVFQGLRGLALQMQGALQMKKKDDLRSIYCWKFILSLEAWERVLSTHSASNPELKPLVYPLCQLLTATSRLVPSARYFPLRLRCVRILQRLSVATGCYVPLSHIVLEVFQSSCLSKPHKGQERQRLALENMLRVPNAAVDSKVVFLLTCEHPRWR